MIKADWNVAVSDKIKVLLQTRPDRPQVYKANGFADARDSRAGSDDCKRLACVGPDEARIGWSTIDEVGTRARVLAPDWEIENVWLGSNSNPQAGSWFIIDEEATDVLA
jgi:hypothetical protein